MLEGVSDDGEVLRLRDLLLDDADRQDEDADDSSCEDEEGCGEATSRPERVFRAIFTV